MQKFSLCGCAHAIQNTTIFKSLYKTQNFQVHLSLDFCLDITVQEFSVPGNLHVTHIMFPSLRSPMGLWTAVLCGIMAATILIFCWQYDTMQEDSTLLWPHVSHMKASKKYSYYQFGMLH